MRMWIVLLCIIPYTSFAQLPHELHLKKLTTSDGLSQGVVNDILLDDLGFMWFSTYDGINRFDGSTCLVNNQIAPGAEDVGLCKFLLKDPDGDIWFGTESALYQFSYRDYCFHKHLINFDSLQMIYGGEVFYSPLASNQSYVLVNNLMFGSVLIHRNSKKIIKIKTPNYYDFTLTIDTVRADLRGLTHRMNNLRVNGDSLTYTYLKQIADTVFVWQTMNLPKHPKMSVTETKWVSDSCILVSDGRYNLWRIDFFPKRLSTLEENDILFTRPIERKKNELWIGSNTKGVLVYDVQQNAFIKNYKENKVNPYGLGSNYVNHLFIAPNNMIWLSTWGDGVQYGSLYEPVFSHHLTDFESKIKGTDNFIRGLVRAADGLYYANTQLDGIIQLDSNFYYTKTITSSPFNTLSCTADGRYLLYGANELSMYDVIKQKEIIYSIPYAQIVRSPGLGDFYSFQVIDNKNILTASVLSVLMLDATTGRFTELPGITQNGVSYGVYAYRDTHGGIFVYSRQKGTQYMVWNGNRYELAATLPVHTQVKHAYQAHDTLVWLGTTNGLFAFNPVKKKTQLHINQKNGLPSHTIYSVVPDTLGKLWLATGRGLCTYNTKTRHIKNFAGYTGQQGKEYNSHSFCLLPDGRIAFGGTNGITVVRPWLAHVEDVMPQIQITSVHSKEDHSPFHLTNAAAVLQLPPGSNALEIGFVGIDYLNATSATFRYRLNGYSNDWQTAKNPGKARFLAVSPGRYTFELMVSNADGTWSDEMKSIQIEVLAHWWETLWFRVLISFLFIVLVVIVIRRYIAYQLYKKQAALEKQLALVQERERITADLHDDIGATLSSMHIYGDLAGRVMEQQPDKSFEMINKVTEQSQELMQKMSDIVWSLKSPQQENNAIALRLKNYCQEFLLCQQIEVDFDIDDKIDKLIANPKQRKNILLIAKEALNNIAKYSRASRAAISLRINGENVLLEISDNGMGMDPQNGKKGNGLENMTQRCEQMDGTHTCHTGIGLGVRHIFSFPLATFRHSEAL